MFQLDPLPRQKTEKTYSLKVDVKDLRNSSGSVQFALYNKDGSLPDENYKMYYRKLTGKILNAYSTVTFTDLPEGKYAVNVLHDENNDGKIKKGFLLPKEGIGFSNYQTIGFSNRPNFQKATFRLYKDLIINIKVIYM